jgi:hypothetical protein
MPEHDFCKQENIIGKTCAKVEELVKFKDQSAEGHEKIWTEINKKASRAFMVTVIILVMSLVVALFGLTYETTLQVKDQLSEIKSDLQLVSEQMKRNGGLQ